MNSIKNFLRNTGFLPIVMILLGCLSLSAQEKSKILSGTVSSPGMDVSNVHIRNINRGTATITEPNGSFRVGVREGDTLLFTAVQFKRKMVVIEEQIWTSARIAVQLQEFTNELDEVVLRPYGLSGELGNDLKGIETGPIISETTLNLPNAQFKPPTQNERKLYTARTWDFKVFGVKLDPLINYFSGRTKMLKKRVKRDSKAAALEAFSGRFADSLFVHGLKIPKDHIYDFLFFCETDRQFASVIQERNTYQAWVFLNQKSHAYRKNNNLE